jgi:hypothetical protein
VDERSSLAPFLARLRCSGQQTKRQKLGFFSRVVTTKIDIEILTMRNSRMLQEMQDGISNSGYRSHDHTKSTAWASVK